MDFKAYIVGGGEVGSRLNGGCRVDLLQPGHKEFKLIKTTTKPQPNRSKPNQNPKQTPNRKINHKPNHKTKPQTKQKKLSKKKNW
jgi:hypothetical protein